MEHNRKSQQRSRDQAHEQGGDRAGDQAKTSDTRTFGPKLREFRETYHVRLADTSSSAYLARARLTSSAVVECLRQAGYEISLPSYSEIEAGANMPRDAALFLGIVEKCLGLKPEERRDLERRLAYDILYARLGPRAGAILSRPPTPLAPRRPRAAMFGLVLRDCRLTAGLSLEELAQSLLEHGFSLNAQESRVLERIKMSPAAYLADRLEEIEQADLDTAWPLDMSVYEVVTLLARCLPPTLLVGQRLPQAAALDELARKASASPEPAAD